MNESHTTLWAAEQAHITDLDKRPEVLQLEIMAHIQLVQLAGHCRHRQAHGCAKNTC